MKTLLTKFFLLFAATLAALSIVGSGFSGAVPIEKNVTPVQAGCDWTGFYIGLNANLANFQPKFTDLDYWEGYDTRTFGDTSFIGGGQAGYNWQWQNLVLGLEFDADGATGDITTHTDFNNTFAIQDDKAKADFIGTGRIRLGVAPAQNILIYGTGGGAYAHGRWDEFYARQDGTETADWRGDDWRWGWVGGMGIEYMLGCHWTIRAEGLYTHLQDNTVSARIGGTSPTLSDARFRYRFEDDLWSFGVGINYKFTGFFGR
jgi:outer membrane immunogenic protein